MRAGVKTWCVQGQYRYPLAPLTFAAVDLHVSARYSRALSSKGYSLTSAKTYDAPEDFYLITARLLSVNDRRSIMYRLRKARHAHNLGPRHVSLTALRHRKRHRRPWLRLTLRVHTQPRQQIPMDHASARMFAKVLQKKPPSGCVPSDLPSRSFIGHA